MEHKNTRANEKNEVNENLSSSAQVQREQKDRKKLRKKMAAAKKKAKTKVMIVQNVRSCNRGPRFKIILVSNEYTLITLQLTQFTFSSVNLFDKAIKCKWILY